jgi:hypothetical protein
MENEEIINFVDQWENSLGMSDFQSRHFVVNSQVTDYRRVRQALVEIDTRIGMKKQIERNRKKRIIEKQIIERSIAEESDPLKEQLLQVDLEQAVWDIHMYDKKERMCENELNNFIKMIKDIVPNIEELKKYNEHDEVREREYWVTRMAKQAAMDLNTIGRISQGNMDSILMMPLGDVKQTLQLAVKYNGVLGKGLEAIGRAAMDEVHALENTLTYIDDLANKQLKLEDKSPGENI